MTSPAIQTENAIPKLKATFVLEVTKMDPSFPFSITFLDNGAELPNPKVPSVNTLKTLGMGYFATNTSVPRVAPGRLMNHRVWSRDGDPLISPLNNCPA